MSSHGNLMRVGFIDSHTGGEPTRVITSGFPELRGASLTEKRADLSDRLGPLCRLVVDEPRGTEATVGALLVEPAGAEAVSAVIFFDRAAALGMCGHGTIGVVETLRHLGRIGPGLHSLETPAGVVAVELHTDGGVTLANVPSRRLSADVKVQVDGLGEVVGDIAWGGNTFFLVKAPVLDLDAERGELLRLAASILQATHRAGFDAVDHVELYGLPTLPGADSRNFVLCPSGTYDRSPCGTGTSAKLSCLAADGHLGEGQNWVQESITGSVFTARYVWDDRAAGRVLPSITGSASIMAEGHLLFGPDELAGAVPAAVGDQSGSGRWT